MTVPYGFASGRVRRFDVTKDAETNDVESVALLPDQFALLAGTPVVPAVWVDIEFLVDADGVTYNDRPSILAINSDAYARFVPTDDLWDGTAFVLNPALSTAVTRYQLDGGPLSSPLRGDLDYRIGREQFTAAALSFSDDELLTSDFNSGFDDAYAFTLAVAVNLGESDQQLVTFLDGSYLKTTERGMEAKVGDHVFSVDVPQGVFQANPVYVVLQVDPPTATLTVGFSPTKLYRGSSPVSERTTSFVFTLNGPMDLYSLDLWGDTSVSATEVIARYSSVLGAN